MTVTTTTTVTHTLTVEDLPFDAVLDFEPVEHIAPVVHPTDTGYTVAYAIADYDSFSFGDSEYILGEGVEFEEFRTEWERDEYVNDTGDFHVAFVVDHYEHGGHAYSLTNTESYHHGAWDTRPSCVLRVPKDFTEPREAAKALLRTWTDYVNGNVYAVVVQYFDKHGATNGDTDSVGGFIGDVQAEEALRSPEDYF